jgi:hypothetical protein
MSFYQHLIRIQTSSNLFGYLDHLLTPLLLISIISCYKSILILRKNYVNQTKNSLLLIVIFVYTFVVNQLLSEDGRLTTNDNIVSYIQMDESQYLRRLPHESNHIRFLRVRAWVGTISLSSHHSASSLMFVSR